MGSLTSRPVWLPEDWEYVDLPRCEFCAESPATRSLIVPEGWMSWKICDSPACEASAKETITDYDR